MCECVVCDCVGSDTGKLTDLYSPPTAWLPFYTFWLIFDHAASSPLQSTDRQSFFNFFISKSLNEIYYICVRVCNGSVIKYVCVCVYKSSEMDNGCTATVAWFVITQLGAYNCPPSPPNLSFVHFPPFLLQIFPSFTSPPSSSSFLFDRFWVKLRGGGDGDSLFFLPNIKTTF